MLRVSGKEQSRIDVALVERGLAASRERARALILAGRVLVNEQKVTKAGTTIAADAAIRLLGEDLKYVSRGGLKLEAALEHWAIDVTDRVCVDIGTSTGGFTDCMLQRGAAQVTAVDTGFGQIAMKLRNDARVRLMERTNARLLAPGTLGGEATLAVMDVSFISATLVLPAVVEAAPGLEEIVVLVKPQFEAGRQNVGKGGIVRDTRAQKMSVERVADCLRGLGWEVAGVMESPILGVEGNREFLLYGKKRS
jgi:23S rRNA (cytidine1920-2'-O)/16S rRNA (cytidine1409-2'-O)-methyltransferase